MKQRLSLRPTYRVWQHIAAPVKAALAANLLIVVGGLCFGLGGWYVCGAPTWPILIAVLFACVVLAATCYLGVRRATQRAARLGEYPIASVNDQSARDSVLEQHLATRAERCPSCGYDLRGLAGHHCPECGEALRLRVGLENPILAPFFVGLCALVAASVFSALELVLLGVFLFTSPDPNMSLGVPAFLVAELLASLVLVVSWVLAGHWIRRQTHRVSWSLAIAAWMGLVLSIVFFALFAYF